MNLEQVKAELFKKGVTMGVYEDEIIVGYFPAEVTVDWSEVEMIYPDVIFADDEMMVEGYYSVSLRR